MNLDKLREHFNNPENVKAAREHFAFLENNKQNNIRRIKDKIENLSDKEVNVLFENFLKWEKKYEDYYYKKGILTESNIFEAICDYIQKYGKESDIEYDDFMTGSWDYKEYRFKLYIGQGSFWRIEKNDEFLFATT